MKGFRERIGSYISILGHPLEKPIIVGPYGIVTESARLQAAINMRIDPVKRAEVVAVLAKQFGSIAKGEAEARRRYPEGFE